MTEQLHRDERALYLEQLSRRAERLARLARMPHRNGDIPHVLGMFTWNLLKAAIPLCGDELRREVFGWCAASMRAENGLCRFCGGQKPTGESPMCKACHDEALEMDHQALLEDADEGAPQ